MSAGFRLAAVGDGLFYRPFATHAPPTRAVLDAVRECDAGFVNLEAPLGHPKAYPVKQYSWGGYPYAEDWLGADLYGAGFRLISLANNHAMNYSRAAQRHTRRVLRQASLACAGTGETLAAARTPAFFDLPAGRVALIAVDTSYEWGEFRQVQMASDTRDGIPGRPGTNGLRWYAEYEAIDDVFDSLRAYAQQLRRFPGFFPVSLSPHPTSSRTPATRASIGIGMWHTGPDDLVFLGQVFRRAASNGVRTWCDERDLAAITASVELARRQADWVVVSCHAHEVDRFDPMHPAQHVVEFAHSCIDSGAHVFLAHGGGIKSVEVRHGRPIFYDLGKFAEEFARNRVFPADLYDAWELGPGADPADFFDARQAHFEAAADGESLRRLLAVYQYGLLVSIDMRASSPRCEIRICERSGGSRPNRGSPQFATAPVAAEQLTQLARASAEQFGTQIDIKDGLGVLQPAG